MTISVCIKHNGPNDHKIAVERHSVNREHEGFDSLAVLSVGEEANVHVWKNVELQIRAVNEDE